MVPAEVRGNTEWPMVQRVFNLRWRFGGGVPEGWRVCSAATGGDGKRGSTASGAVAARKRQACQQQGDFFLCVLYTSSFAVPQIPLCQRMMGLNTGLLRLRHWLTDALTTRLYLIHRQRQAPAFGQLNQYLQGLNWNGPLFLLSVVWFGSCSSTFSPLQQEQHLVITSLLVFLLFV